MAQSIKKNLSLNREREVITILKDRFASNMSRHNGIVWSDVLARLEGKKAKIWSLNEMEETGGEPDVIGQDVETGEFIFCDCSAESPKGRRSLCYDSDALEARKEAKPANSAENMAKQMGIILLNEDEYLALQKLGTFDSKTSSWIKTPDKIRKLGGAIFVDFRYAHVFVYHNGAQSYYSSRGFRGSLRV